MKLKFFRQFKYAFIESGLIGLFFRIFASVSGKHGKPLYRKMHETDRYLSGNTRRNIKRNIDVQGNHKGKKCFVLATGSTLNNHDLNRLKNEDVISINELFNFLPQYGIKPKYHIVQGRAYFSDKYRYVQFREDLVKEVKKNKINLVLNIAGHSVFKNSDIDNLFWYLQTGELLDYKENNLIPQLDFSKILPGLYTVTHTAIAWALFLGYSEIHILGVDLDFADDATTPIKHCYSKAYNNDHLVSVTQTYKNDKGWSIDRVKKQIELQISAYEFLREIAEHNNQAIYDCTYNKKLGNLPKRNFDDLFINT